MKKFLEDCERLVLTTNIQALLYMDNFRIKF